MPSHRRGFARALLRGGAAVLLLVAPAAASAPVARADVAAPMTVTVGPSATTFEVPEYRV